MNEPGKYDKFARKNCAQKHDGKCIDVIFGIKEGKSEIQALRYSKDAWDAGAARSHCNSRNGRFEAAQEKMMSKERVLLYLQAELKPYVQLDDKQKLGSLQFDRSTILIGDKTFNGIYFPKDEIAKTEKFWDTKPIVWDHSRSVKDTVGDITETYYDLLTGKLTVKPLIEGYAESDNAQKYISQRIKVGAVPNVSVGVWLDRCKEETEDGETRLTARNLEPEHLGIVRIGACNPQDGCGIGLEEKHADTDTPDIPGRPWDDNDDEEKLAAPQSPFGPKAVGESAEESKNEDKEKFNHLRKRIELLTRR